MASPNKLPAGIRMRGSKYFVDASFKGDRLTATCDTLDEAIAKQHELKAALRQGRDEKPEAPKRKGTWSLGEAVDACLQDYWAVECPRGYKTHEINCNMALRFFGRSIKLTEIDSEAVVNYQRHLRQKCGSSESTVAKKTSTLRMVFKHAAEMGRGPEQPPKMKMPKQKGGRIRFLSDDEEAQVLGLLRHMGKPDHADAVTLMIDTGLRNAEVWAIQRRDVDLKGKLLLVYGEGDRTKTGNYRSVPLTKRLLEVLQRRCHGLAPTDRVFPYSNPWLRHAWDTVKHTMGLDEDDQFVPYICRHTCCSRLVMKGVPLPVVKEWMGHTAIETTMRYAHLAPVTLFAAVKALDGWNRGDTEAQPLNLQDTAA